MGTTDYHTADPSRDSGEDRRRTRHDGIAPDGTDSGRRDIVEDRRFAGCAPLTGGSRVGNVPEAPR